MPKTETILPNDVLIALEDFGGSAKRADIAQRLECSEGTVSRKVAQLIKSGENIGFDRDGLFIQHPKDVHSMNGYDRAAAWRDRIVVSLIMWSKRGNNHKPVAISARKRFAKELTREERNTLKSQLLLISRVVDAVNLDEELA